MAVREQMHFDRPARGKRHEGREVFAAQHDTFGATLKLQNALEKIRSERRDRVDDPLRARCDIGVSVNLPVRVVKRDTDRLPAILEDKNLLDARQRTERRGAVCPGLDHGAHSRLRQLGEGASRERAEAHHFAASHSGRGSAEADAVEADSVGVTRAEA